MLQTASLGQSLPLPPPPVLASRTAGARGADARGADDIRGIDGDHDDFVAASCATPREGDAVALLVRRILSTTMLAKHWIAWACVSVGLWAIGTAIAIVVRAGGAGVLVLGFGGLASGVVAGALWFGKRYLEARKIAREGQLLMGVTTFRRARETLGGELSETFGVLLGEPCHSVLFSVGFIRHEVRVAFVEAPPEGARCPVLVQPGARYALVFDRQGRAHVGDVLRLG